MSQRLKQNIVLLIIQLTVWIIMMLAPSCVSYLINPSSQRHWIFLWQSMQILSPMFVIYMISFYVLVPYIFFKGHRFLYCVATLALLLLVDYRFFFNDVSMLPKSWQDGFYSLIGSSLFIHLIVAFAAFALRSYLRTLSVQHKLEEEQRKSTEAELNWLKNQLNPHFLFNSLNNISSLTQIDPDQAQDAIAQLSDLLRYALYESNKPRVPLMSELEFMQNYISMMKLRCSALTTVNVDFPTTCPATITVAPLIFISFIENAFKHGVSNTTATEINISLIQGTGNMVFECRNTNLPKSIADQSGSGIGLENTHRRLELLYPGKYEWQQQIVDNEFRIRITINA